MARNCCSCPREESLKAVELIVAEMGARGYAFVTVSELLALRET